MTSHDYQYRHQRRQAPPPRPRRRSPISRAAIVNLLVGVFLGLGLALLYAWALQPVKVEEAIPGSLQGNYQDDYVLLIAEAYNVDQDLDVALARLDTLQLDDAAGHVVALTERMIGGGANRSDIRRMVGLAFALGAVTPPMEPYLP